MPLPPASAPGAPAQAQVFATTPLNQSRETGEILPGSRIDDGSIAKHEKPVAKPWAHFVAGGYVLLSTDAPRWYAESLQPWGYDIRNVDISS